MKVEKKLLNIKQKNKSKNITNERNKSKVKLSKQKRKIQRKFTDSVVIFNVNNNKFNESYKYHS